MPNKYTEALKAGENSLKIYNEAMGGIKSAISEASRAVSEITLGKVNVFIANKRMNLIETINSVTKDDFVPAKTIVARNTIYEKDPENLFNLAVIRLSENVFPCTLTFYGNMLNISDISEFEKALLDLLSHRDTLMAIHRASNFQSLGVAASKSN